MVTIINRHARPKPVSGDTLRYYVGRPSILGNPFTIGIDGDRQEVIAKYRAYLEGALKTNENLKGAINNIIAMSNKGHDIELECWCAPQTCHAEVLKEYIDKGDLI